MHVFTILNTWYMNTLTEANNKILLVGVILQDNLNSDDNLKHLLYMLEKFNMRSYISEKSYTCKVFLFQNLLFKKTLSQILHGGFCAQSKNVLNSFSPKLQCCCYRFFIKLWALHKK